MMIASSKLCKSMLVIEVTLTGYQTVSFVILNVTCVLFLLNAFGSLVHQPLSENLVSTCSAVTECELLLVFIFIFYFLKEAF